METGATRGTSGFAKGPNPLTRLGAVSTSFAANPRKSLGTIEPRKHLRLSALRSPSLARKSEGRGERKKQSLRRGRRVGRIRRADRFLTRPRSAPQARRNPPRRPRLPPSAGYAARRARQLDRGSAAGR
jgi:hypothetical protein